MNVRRFFLEAAALIVVAVVCALVSNALAARERKMALVGFYPNAQKVPAQATETTAVTATVVTPPASTTTNAAPATTTIVVPTATVAPKTTTPTTKSSSAPPAPAPAPTPAPTPKKQDLSRFTPHPDKPYIELKYDDVAALHDGGALFLDARRTSVYEQGHIAGARPFSVWESDIADKIRALWEQRQDPKEQALPIVVYCSGGDCEDSHMLAQKLFETFFTNVYVYKDGYPDWVAHRAPTRTGPNP